MDIEFLLTTRAVYRVLALDLGQPQGLFTVRTLVIYVRFSVAPLIFQQSEFALDASANRAEASVFPLSFVYIS